MTRFDANKPLVKNLNPTSDTKLNGLLNKKLFIQFEDTISSCRLQQMTLHQLVIWCQE